MKRSGGQALVELALCAPVVILLALGVATVVQVQTAAAGLDAATKAAASAAARAPDPHTADVVARSRFADVVTGYPLSGATIRISIGSFDRATDVTATSLAFVELGWAALVPSRRVDLRSRAVMRLEPWRTHRAA